MKPSENLENESHRAPPVVSGHALGRDYGEKVVLKRIDFQISSGEVVAFTGPNGCGKTTLLKMVSTLLPTSRGRIQIFDKDLSGRDVNSIRRRLGVVFSDLLLYEDLTIEENLDLFAVLYDVENRREKVLAWIDRLQISGVFQERIRNLSRGQQQRAAIARSLLHNPELIIWDEPLTALDRDGRQLMHEIIDEKRGSCTFLIATHDENVAENWIDRRLVIKDGFLSA